RGKGIEGNQPSGERGRVLEGAWRARRRESRASRPMRRSPRQGGSSPRPARKPARRAAQVPEGRGRRSLGAHRAGAGASRFHRGASRASAAAPGEGAQRGDGWAGGRPRHGGASDDYRGDDRIGAGRGRGAQGRGGANRGRDDRAYPQERGIGGAACGSRSDAGAAAGAAVRRAQGRRGADADRAGRRAARRRVARPGGSRCVQEVLPAGVRQSAIDPRPDIQGERGRVALSRRFRADIAEEREGAMANLVQELIDQVVIGAKSRLLDDLQKADSFSAGINGQQLVWYDLDESVRYLYPFEEQVPLVAGDARRGIPPLPRVPARGGNATHWKTVTAINPSNLSGGVARGQRGGTIAVDTRDMSAAYKSLGLEASIDFETRYEEGELNPDNLSTAVQSALRSVLIYEEKCAIFGNCSLALGVTPTPALTASA